MSLFFKKWLDAQFFLCKIFAVVIEADCHYGFSGFGNQKGGKMSNEKQKNFRIILASIVGAAEEAKIAYNKAVAGRDETFEKIEMINDQISGLRGDRDTQFKIGQPMLAVPIEIEIAELEAGRATINVEMAEIEIQMRKYDETVAGLHVKLYRALADNNIGIEIINIRNADDPIDEAKKFFTKNFI